MNKLKTISLVAAGAAMMSQAVQAQSNPNNNDLVLGFTSQASGVTQDMVLDLGPIPSVTFPTTYQLDGTTADLSAFTSVFGSALASGQVNVGIIGGLGGGVKDVILSTLDGGNGNATKPTGPNPSKGNIANAAGDVLSLNAYSAGSAAGENTTGAGSSTSWFASIAENPTTVGSSGSGTTYAEYVNNPMYTINGSTKSITLDLYKDSGTATSGSATTGWTYAGNVTIDLSGSSLSAIYSAPEPSSVALFGGAGLLALAFRRQIIRKNG
jgi:hypothetical protein